MKGEMTMLSLAELYENQAKYGVGSLAVSTEIISYKQYLQECRRNLNEKTPADYYAWDVKRQTDYTDNLIVQFARNNLKNVEGFIDENGEVKQSDLINRLKIDIIDAGILKDALNDDSVQEIQINDAKSIWVVRHGRYELYTDELGNPYQFVSDEELHSTLYRLMYNPKVIVPRMTVAEPLLNARTASKGYRVSALHNSATTADSKKGFDFPVTTVTIRKHSPQKFTFKDFVNSGMMVEEMAEFIRLCGLSDAKILFVGPVSSAKTTLLDTVSDEIPKDQRMILIQNPTEIVKYERDPKTGTNMRNVLHWEAIDKDTTNVNENSTENLISHSLRNSGDIIIPGEIRRAGEIEQAMRAAKTGHRLLSTLHAEGMEDAFLRCASEMATLGGSQIEHLRSIAKNIDIVIALKRLHDGTRKIMSIEESMGISPSGEVLVNKIYDYKFTGNADYDEQGNLQKIHGYFQYTNPISDNLKQKFYSVGITPAQLERYTRKPAEADIWEV